MQLLFPHDSDTYALRCRPGSPPRSSSATTRSTSRWTSTRSFGSSTSRATRARDHLVVSVHRTDREARSQRAHEVDPRRAVVGGGAGPPHWTELGDAVLADEPPEADAVAGRPRFRTAAWADWRRAARRAGARTNGATARACRVGHRHRDRGGRARRARRPRPGQGRRATSSCRRGTRAATAPRSGARSTPSSRPSTSSPATTSTRPPPRRPRPRASSVGSTTSPRSPASALASHTVREAVATDGYRREMYVATPGGRAHARGLRRPRLPHRRGSGRRRLQDRRVARRVRPRRQGRPATGCRVRRTRSHSRRRRANRWRAACSCSSVPAAPTNARGQRPSAGCSRRYEHFSRRLPDPNEHQHAADRAGDDHQRGVGPGPPDVGADDHGHGDERQPHETVDESRPAPCPRRSAR